MNVGDLVKRSSMWFEWMRRNSWHISMCAREIGMIIEFDPRVNGDSMDVAGVLWPFTGISWEDVDDLEVISESR